MGGEKGEGAGSGQLCQDAALRKREGGVVPVRRAVFRDGRSLSL